jgi:hypothetical protein
MEDCCIASILAVRAFHMDLLVPALRRWRLWDAAYAKFSGYRREKGRSRAYIGSMARRLSKQMIARRHLERLQHDSDPLLRNPLIWGIVFVNVAGWAAVFWLLMG